jgi:integrase/recombinase XerD
MTISEVSKILNVVYKEEKETVNPTSYHQKELIRNITVLELLFATGIRVSELCSLKVKDVDLKNWTIKVFGKGSKERVIQICEQEVKVLLKKCFTLYRPDNENVNCFFINRVGAPLSTQSVRLMIHKYVKQAGLEKRITPHTFRHTFATLLLEEDVDIRYIQNLLGHSTITTTQIYTHVNSEKQKKILATKHPRRKLSFS